MKEDALHESGGADAVDGGDPADGVGDRSCRRTGVCERTLAHLYRRRTFRPDGEPFGGVDLIHPEDRERTAEIFVDALRTKRPYEVEHRMRRADGSYRWVLARAQPLIDAMGKVAHWFGTSTDIQERKAAEDLLRRTEKLAAAGRLAATVAHEINNPLEAVGNLLYLALQKRDCQRSPRLSADGERGAAPREAYREPDSGFLSRVRMSQSIDLSDLVNDVLSLYQRKLDARQIRVTRSMESVTVEGIAGELRQVMANLLSNALDAMEPYGVLAIEVRPQNDEVRLLDLRYRARHRHAIARPYLRAVLHHEEGCRHRAGAMGIQGNRGEAPGAAGCGEQPEGRRPRHRFCDDAAAARAMRRSA